VAAGRDRSGLRALEIAALAFVLLASVAAGAAHYLGAPPVLAFSIAALALAGLAWTVSFATEQVGERFGPAITGVLQSTLGNLPEFFVVLFALSAGEVVIAQTSLIGSVLANALLVLGLAMVAGSFRSEGKVMRFGRRLPNDTATLLLVAVFIIALVGVSVAVDDGAARHVKAISVIGAVCLLGVYLTWLFPYLRSDREPSRGQARLGFSSAATLLLASGIGAAFVSDWFVAELRPTIDRFGISAAFAGRRRGSRSLRADRERAADSPGRTRYQACPDRARLVVSSAETKKRPRPMGAAAPVSGLELGYLAQMLSMYVGVLTYTSTCWTWLRSQAVVVRSNVAVNRPLELGGRDWPLFSHHVQLLPVLIAILM